MRKIISVFLAVILCGSFIGCVPSDEPIKEQATVQSKTEKEDEVFGLNESAVFKDLKFTATEIKESKGKDFFEPEADNIFVGIKFEVENVSEEEQTVSTLLLFDAYCDDIKCEYSLSANCVFDGTLDGTIAPGKKLVGWYSLEVPADWGNIELNIQSNWLSSNAAKFVFTK